ncbi:MAG: thiamine pyrophosphate-binding protein [Kiloniellales bacterium]|nr:thiamine pyrophosphate-binding protein [Kiloniellales bacterium]
MPRTSELVVDTMIAAGIERAFTLPGLGVTWSLPAFSDRRDDIDVVLTRSEWIASVMAQTTGRLTGKPAALMGQGPWLTTIGAAGILEAHFAGSPMLVLTETSDYDGYGQMGVYQTMTGDYGGADAMASLKPITKYATYATTPEEAVFGVQMAVKHASLPRRGPAAVVMKTPIIRQEVPEPTKPRLYPTEGYLRAVPAKPDEAAVRRLAAMIDAAERPVFVAGNGVGQAGASALLEELAEGAGVAVATSYNGKGTIAELSPVSVGMLGTWGHPCANRAVAAADLVVMLGASMGPDYTRFRDPDLIRPGEQRLVQVDIDPRNAGWVYPVDLAITADLADLLGMLRQVGLKRDGRAARLAAITAVQKATRYGVLPSVSARQGYLHHADIVRSLQSFLTPDDYLVLDAGANRIWSTFGLRMPYRDRLLVAGGTGIMGWGPPAAAAAKLVHRDKRVTCLAGDGGFMMTMQVISTCVQQDAPVVFVVDNNAGLGMVRDNLGDKRIAVDFADVDFAAVAEAMGGRGLRVNQADELTDALVEAHRLERPVVIDVAVDPDASHHEAVDNAPLR